MNYIFHILVMTEIYIMLALGANLVAGQARLFSLCQAVFYGIGAYATTQCLLKFNLSFLPAIMVAILINIVIAWPVTWFAQRLKHLYFTLATMSWQILVFAVLYNWTWLTNGPYGISGIPHPAPAGHQLQGPLAFCLLGGVFCLLTVLFCMFFERTHLARLIKATGDDSLAMISLGHSPQKYQRIAILLGTVFSTFSGALYAVYISFIDPGSFDLNESILILSMVLIGGLGSIKGAIAGVLVYELLPEAMKLLPIPDEIAPNLRLMIYALALILTVLYRPFGLFGKFRFE